MAAKHPIFGTQVFEIDPYRLPLSPCHCFDERLRRCAGECGNHHVAGLPGWQRLGPMDDVHTFDALHRLIDIQRRDEAMCARKIIDPQTHGKAMFARQLPRQAPAHTDIAEVIHNGTKNIPTRGDGCGRRQDWGQIREKMRTDCAQTRSARRDEISSTIAAQVGHPLADRLMNCLRT